MKFNRFLLLRVGQNVPVFGSKSKVVNKYTMTNSVQNLTKSTRFPLQSLFRSPVRVPGHLSPECDLSPSSLPTLLSPE